MIFTGDQLARMGAAAAEHRAQQLECPRCHSLAGVECCETVRGYSAELRSVPDHAERVAAAETRSSAFVPMDAQLGLDGSERDLAPASERLKLFEPPPIQLDGQTWLELDGSSESTLGNA